MGETVITDLLNLTLTVIQIPFQTSFSRVISVMSTLEMARRYLSFERTA